MKPYISKKNKISGLKFATEHVIWTEELCDYIHYSDESKFHLFGCDERRFVRCSPKEQYSPQCTKSSVKFGGVSVMVFSMSLKLERKTISWKISQGVNNSYNNNYYNHRGEMSSGYTVKLSGYTVKLTQLYTKRYWTNMLYLIWVLHGCQATR